MRTVVVPQTQNTKISTEIVGGSSNSRVGVVSFSTTRVSQCHYELLFIFQKKWRFFQKIHHISVLFFQIIISKNLGNENVRGVTFLAYNVMLVLLKMYV